MKKTHQTESNNQETSNPVDEQFDFTGVTIPPTIGNYKLLKSIGYGACSLVKQCQRISPKNKPHQGKEEYFACKIIPKIRLNTARMIRSFEQEIRIIQQLHHPGIVQLIELLKDENNYYVILEYCPKGDLFSHIVNNKKLQEPEAKIIFKQFLEALKYLHSMNVSHRDLKPENVLFGLDNHVKISDFGLSKFLLESKKFLVRTPCGSLSYASPECLSGMAYNGKITDAWSSGVILFTMLTGHLPWTKHRDDLIARQIKRAEFSCPKYVSNEAKSLINGLLTVDIYRRYSVDQALNDPWFHDVPSSLNPGFLIKGFVSMKKVDQFFDKEINDESLITTLKIRKRITIEPVNDSKDDMNTKNENDKDKEKPKKLSFFQKLKMKKAMKADSKSKSKDKKKKSDNDIDNENTNSDVNLNINANDSSSLIISSGIDNNDKKLDYFCGLKRSISSPSLNSKGIQKKQSIVPNKHKKWPSDEYYNCNYINLL